EGDCVMLARPLDLLDPKRAFTENPHRPIVIDLRYEGLSPGFGGEPREERDGKWVSMRIEATGQEFARGHLEQHGRAVGKVPVDGGMVERVTGRVLALVPLRNRRAGMTTRIAEGLTEWTWGQRTGYGWSEYLDHVD